MNVCIPVEEDQGLSSRVCSHFGSAPIFMLVDSDTSDCRAIPNTNQHHAYGMCMPLRVLEGEKFDALIVRGIGMGALGKLESAGIAVYMAEHATVGETIAALQAGSLKKVRPSMACAGHGHKP